MRKIFSALALFCLPLHAADWPTAAGNPQRDGWAKSETAFTKDNVKGLELLYKYKAAGPLTTPMVLGRLITYLGFKEMLVFAGKSNDVYSVDADLNRLIWKAPLKTQPRAAGACAGGLSAPVAMAGSSTAVVARVVRPAVPTAGPVVPVRRPTRGGEFFAISSDGYFHILNPSTGEDRQPPVKFLPPGAKASALNVSDGEIYAVVLDGCGAQDEGLYAIDTATGSVVSRQAQGGHLAGSAGTAVGSDGFVFAQAQNVHGEVNDMVFALAPKTLQVRDYFVMQSAVAARVPGVTPVAFTWKGRELLAAAASDGELYLFEAKSLGQPLFQNEARVPGGFHGAFASWEDPDTKDRWLYASSASHVTGFKLDERAGKPVLTKAWETAAGAPSAPTIANGIVFALAEAGAHAALVAYDAATGRELYNSGSLVSAAAHDAGLAIANRRIYFAADDGSVYCFGFSVEQPQLTGR